MIIAVDKAERRELRRLMASTGDETLDSDHEDFLRFALTTTDRENSQSAR